ncbi:MAG: hypothetical protein ACRENL_01520 [Candidatus Dormibacteria bacterium]
MAGGTDRLVFATEDVFLRDDEGLGYAVVANSAWDPTDPLVKRHPQWFAAAPPKVMRTRMPVEQATRSPGEFRELRPRRG